MATWSLRERPARSRPPTSGPTSSSSSRSRAPWTSSSEGAGTQVAGVVPLPQHRQPAQQLGVVGLGEQAGAVQGVGVRPGAGEVVGRQLPVEVRRPRQRLELRATDRSRSGRPRASPRWWLPLVGHQSVPTSIAALSSASSSSCVGAVAPGDAVGAAGLDLAEEVAVLDQHVALVLRLAGVELELAARVGDVEVAHGELADPVGRTEDGVVGALHRQLVGVVGERRAVGGEDGVVLTATQPQRHLAGDERRHPALDRLAHHQRLRVEPAALVEQAAEPAALVVVVARWCPRCGRR